MNNWIRFMNIDLFINIMIIIIDLVELLMSI